MKKNKFAAKFFLFLIAFSLCSALLPAIDGFAQTNEKPSKSKTIKAKKETLNEIYGNVGVVKIDVKSAPTAGSTPISQADVDKLLDSAKGNDKFDMIGKDERAALEDLRGTDMCGRHDGGWIGLGALGDSTYLEMLLFLVGDATGDKFEGVKTNLADFKIQPEAVPSTAYKCFPDAWKTKYKTKAEWETFQDTQGTRSCGTFDLGCKVEKLLKEWVRRAIIAGMTWIIDIATGSGSGEAADACRPNRGADGVTAGSDKPDPNSIVKGFTPAQAKACTDFLNRYYAMPEIGDTTNHTKVGELVASGTTMSAAPDPGSGDSSVNNDSERLFYGKSTTIGAFLAIAMVIGAVIQGMVQSKPVIIFKVVCIYVPIFGLSLWMAPTLTNTLLGVVDGIGYYMADNSAYDIANVASAFGTTAGQAAGDVSGVQAGVGGVLLWNMMSNVLMILGIVAFVFIMISVALWALMMFREASILMVLALLPIALSMNIWPGLAKISHKFIKLLISLIVSKIPIVMALSMGINMMSEWVTEHMDGDNTGALRAGADGLRQFILAMAIFGIALAAPTLVITMFDAVGDMAQTLGSKAHTGVARAAQLGTGIKANMGASFGARSGSLTNIGGNKGGGASALPAGGQQQSNASGVAPAAVANSTGSNPGTAAPTSTPTSGAKPTGTAATGNSASDSDDMTEKGGRAASKEITSQLAGATDGRGRAAKQWRNGGAGQHAGAFLYGRARYNQEKNLNAPGRGAIGKGLRTAKNATMAGIGKHVHDQGRANAAGLRQKPAVLASMPRGIYNAVRDIQKME